MKKFMASENFKLKTIIGFVIFAMVFFAIDWMTKHFLFNSEDVDWNNRGAYLRGTQSDYVVIAFRSVAHDNSTIFSKMNLILPDWAHYLINFTIATIFAIIPFFSKSLLLGIGCGITIAGIFGNTFDKVFSMLSSDYEEFGNRTFVRDIFYIPWFDRGTFNFADVAIIIGTSLLVVHIIKISIQEFRKTH